MPAKRSLILNLSGAVRGKLNEQAFDGGSRNATAESAIAYNINGVYISRPSGVGPIFFDLERAEVLKGLQGTLYGRNATGGAINLIARKPSIHPRSSDQQLFYANIRAPRTYGVMVGKSF